MTTNKLPDIQKAKRQAKYDIQELSIRRHRETLANKAYGILNELIYNTGLRGERQEQAKVIASQLGSFAHTMYADRNHLQSKLIHTLQKALEDTQ